MNSDFTFEDYRYCQVGFFLNESHVKFLFNSVIKLLY